LPAFVRKWLAAYRFGYILRGSAFDLTRRGRRDGTIEYALSHGQTFVVDADVEQDVAFHFVENGASQAEMRGFLRLVASAPKDAVLIDVGAHKGLFALMHLLGGASHRAVLLEPSPPLVDAAHTLLARNGVASRADVRLAGAAAAPGLGWIVPDALGFARVVPPGDPTATRVPFVTIDDLCAELRIVPSLIKIDVEGAEAQVLRGAQRTLRDARPVLCLELHLDTLEQSGESVAELIDGLRAAGYRFESSGGVPLPPWWFKRSLMAIVRFVARP